MSFFLLSTIKFCLNTFQNYADILMFLSCLCTEPNAASNVQATTTVDSLTATWVAPTTDSMTTYTVTLKKGSETKATTPGVSGTTTTFNSLSAGTEYTVVVVSVIGGQSSDPVEGKFYTSKSQ